MDGQPQRKANPRAREVVNKCGDVRKQVLTRAKSTLLVAAMLAVILTSCAAAQTRESTGEFVPDGAITAKVKGALLNDKVARGLDVHVKTFKGTVERSAFVGTNQDKQRAARVAHSVNGVSPVVNDLVAETTG